jgi:hypothetical protein
MLSFFAAKAARPMNLRLRILGEHPGAPNF